MKKFAGRLILILNIIAALLLLLAYSAPYVNPSLLLIPAFLGLMYPYLLLVNILFLVFWIIRFRKKMGISLIVILLGWNHLMNLFPVRFLQKSQPYDEQSLHLSLLSYNVRMFDRYLWSKDHNSKENIFKLISETEPDIASFQEFYTANRSGSRERDIKKNLAPYKYYSIYYSKKTSMNTGYGIATYSKYPIIKTSRIPFDDTYNLAIYTDIVALGDTIRVFNIHLQSIRLNMEKYSAVDTLSLRDSERQIREMKDISSLIGQAFIKRAEQSKIIHNYVTDSPYPVVVMGDFNDTPISYTYHRIKKGLDDAFRKSGKGLGNTYAGDLPSYRIDYILHSRELQTVEFLRLKSKHSDHFPIQAKIIMAKPVEKPGMLSGDIP